MFFWRITRLKERLAEAPLSPREELPYVIAYVVLSTGAMYIPYGDAQIPQAADGVAATAIAVAGTLYVYHQNGGADGRFFLQRYFALGWVIAVRFVAALLGIYVAYGVALAVAGAEYPDRTPWYETLFLWIAQVILFYRLGMHARDLSGGAQAV